MQAPKIQLDKSLKAYSAFTQNPICQTLSGKLDSKIQQAYIL